LFYPHLYERKEIAFLERTLRSGDCFLDVGSNIGFYALVASRIVGANGRVVAFEADPYNFEKLRMNVELNEASNVELLCMGVSDERATLRLGINATGNRGGNSFFSQSPECVMVDCAPLAEVLRERGITTVAAAKLDIEGFEYRVMRHFFIHAERGLYPRALIVEDNPPWVHGRSEGEDVIALLEQHGYRHRKQDHYNHIFTLEGVS